MPDIHQLSAAVVNKIAAGEVIERPASVVKELIENSVDAGASRIDVAVAKGGTDSIHIADNGCGIEADQLVLAVSSHATSKLRDADDLFRVATLGFRGEALASIAEVSQFRIRSRTNADVAGAELEVHGGERSEVAPCGCPVGTSIQVRNLFFNTPVRRKFMRTVQTEMGHVSEALTRIALPHNDIHFTLSHNDREIYDLPPTDDWRWRIAAIYGQELADSLIPVSTEGPDLRISGFVADPSQSRGNNRMQYLFLNGRHIRDRSLSHALSEAYRGLLMTGRFAIAFLRLKLPAEMVDVNVHPTKLEVRFQDGGKVYSQLLGMLRSRFLSTDLTARARLVDAGEATDRSDSFSQPAGAFANREEINRWANSHANLQSGMGPRPAESRDAGPANANFATGTVSPFRPFSGNESFLPLGHDPGVAGSHAPNMANAAAGISHPSPLDSPRGQQSFSLDFASGEAGSQFPSTSGFDGRTATAGEGSASVPYGSSRPTTGRRTVSDEGTPAMQVYDRYLITETDEGVVIIDQHALHERILYEEIRKKVLGGVMETQRLLVPEPVQLTANEAAAVLDHQETLTKLGMEVEPFGNNTVLVSSYPAMLANLNPSEILRQIAGKLLTPGSSLDRREMLDELLHMISCKAAIKAGDRLTADEIRTLIHRRNVVQDAHHCPHGRPTTLIFSRDELDRRFKRT